MEQGKGSTHTRPGRYERIYYRQATRQRSVHHRKVEYGLVEHLNSDLAISIAHNADRIQEIHELDQSGSPQETEF